jgi:aminoglycoside 6'-N-acetyltransferase I
MRIERVLLKQKDQWINMAVDLWPFMDRVELSVLLDKIISSEKEVLLVAYEELLQPVAFVYVSLRYDYVEGTCSSPVGYIEGIYVKPDYRLQSFATSLIKAAESWSREKGCLEMGSDVELPNVMSQQFHEAVGFEEANRIVCYSKKL